MQKEKNRVEGAPHFYRNPLECVCEQKIERWDLPKNIKV